MMVILICFLYDSVQRYIKMNFFFSHVGIVFQMDVSFFLEPDGSNSHKQISSSYTAISNPNIHSLFPKHVF
jgi:hypothetical protein